MAFKDILNQDLVRKLLQGAIKGQRIAHAYLFTGPLGVGKWFTAIEFAKAVNCLKEGLDSCGECAACKKIDHLTHPDLSLIFPLPPISTGKKSKKERDKKEQENRIRFLEEKISNPYKIVRYEKVGAISIEEIREAQRSLPLTPVEGRYRVWIIQEPEKMSREAQNCFLKTLEEPPKYSLMVLLSSEPEKLLPTIVSRCQRIRFSRIKEELVAGILKRVLALKEDRALHYARLSEGSLGKAFALSQEDKETLRLNGIEFLRIALGKDRIKLVDYISVILEEYERESILELFSFLSGFLRDLYVVLETKEERGLLNPDLKDRVITFITDFNEREKIQKALELIEETRSDVLRNVNLKLALLNLGLELKNLNSDLCRERLAT